MSYARPVNKGQLIDCSISVVDLQSYYCLSQLTMAAFTSTHTEGESSQPVDAVLTEDDIPGAALQPPFSQELHWWLQCRSQHVPTSMNKSQIIERYM